MVRTYPAEGYCRLFGEKLYFGVRKLTFTRVLQIAEAFEPTIRYKCGMRSLNLLSGLTFMAICASAMAAPKAQTLTVEIADRGSIVIELFSEKAPLATAHIGGLAERGFYNGQKIFRVVRSPRPFLAQMGDPNTKNKPLTDESIGQGGSGAKIPFEDTGAKHTVGAVGLAMKADANGKLIGDSQFYFMLGTAGFLDGKYTVFGRITKGLDLLEKLTEGDTISKVTFNRG